jgi:hypothetical protein
MGLSRTWEYEILSKVFHQLFADLLLQIRCGVKNGTLSSGFGQRFDPAVALYPQGALAA